MAMRDVIEEKLRVAFAPTELAVIDESHRHAGHAGARPGGETHFAVTITSSAFSGQTRVAMHRAINAVLKDEFAAGVHALAISAKSSAP
jgi:BolA protein